MKRYLTAFFIALSGVIIFVGLRINFEWNGIVSWGLALICLIFAAYFTKYIPNEKKSKKS
ncbi:hypothetical protein CIL05_06035 [Virgibacillus profundi]|uniref:Uncharacterized protein n=1 Tax=Virgibacillus profundi TaxID=2024555 RepID=A0A2A2IFW1_9BACI|nr:hypothetical protein [Virgibacillus profundi]PAV30659.1 hypothetical protein CIL05_06035 [Virgibacillus profundi]PXY54831.1 hypothetical protein CIT14_06120 [Virgibacillus profundi]